MFFSLTCLTCYCFLNGNGKSWQAFTTQDVAFMEAARQKEALVRNLDSVGDGISDWWRVLYFGGNGTTTNASSCATCDPDGDGMNNLTEFLDGTVPTVPDTLSIFVAEPRQYLP